jgi:hypothetical protein
MEKHLYYIVINIKKIIIQILDIKKEYVNKMDVKVLLATENREPKL